MVTTEEAYIEKCYYLNPSDPIFADHFPYHPVVPGSLIVSYFQQTIEEELRLPSSGLSRIVAARFIHFGKPGWISIRVCSKRGKGDPSFMCEAVQEGRVIATAQLNYESL